MSIWAKTVMSSLITKCLNRIPTPKSNRCHDAHIIAVRTGGSHARKIRSNSSSEKVYRQAAASVITASAKGYTEEMIHPKMIHPKMHYHERHSREYHGVNGRVCRINKSTRLTSKWILSPLGIKGAVKRPKVN